jgi:lipopolysaccharide/colanic/teichoic acid biosynthesis glycosyltransferase
VDELKNTIIVDGRRAARLLQLLHLGDAVPEDNIVGFVDAEPVERRGHPERLAAAVRLFDVDRVVLACSDGTAQDTRDTVQELASLGAQVDVVPSPAALRPARSSAARLPKRTLDVVGSVVGLTLSAPLFAYAAWRIKRDSPGPVLSRRPSLGLGMREFTAFEFRTTTNESRGGSHLEYVRRTLAARADRETAAEAEADETVTPAGRWLQAKRLVELPRLINVLRGDMSLVGPRPCSPEETDGFAPHHFERFLVPAGITGPFQIEPPANSSADELELDVAYARSRSLLLDLKLLLKTPLALARSAY